VNDLHEGCPADYMAVFHTNGSLIRNVLKSLGEDQQWMEFLSAFFGDVRIHNNNQYQFIDPCLENSNISDLTTHQFYILNSNWECDPTQITFPNQTNSYDSIYAYIYQNASLIAELVYNNDPNQTLTDENRSFMYSTTPPIIDLLAFEINETSGLFDSMNFAEDYSHYYAYDYFNHLMGKLRSTIIRVSLTARKIWQRTQVPDGNTECEKEVTEKIIAFLDKIEAKSLEMYNQVNGIYQDARDDKMMRFQLAEQFKIMRDDMKNQNITKIQAKEQ
jgi:hypothetical protein